MLKLREPFTTPKMKLTNPSGERGKRTTTYLRSLRNNFRVRTIKMVTQGVDSHDRKMDSIPTTPDYGGTLREPRVQIGVSTEMRRDRGTENSSRGE